MIYLVTGANRGIGLEICRQLAVADGDATVLLTARDREKGQSAAEGLQSDGLDNVRFQTLDVTDDDSVGAMAAHLRDVYGGLDVLVNNAGMAAKGPELTEEIARTTLAVNFFGAQRVVEALRPLLRDGGRIVNVSSGMGVLDDNYSPAKRDAFLADDLDREAINQLMYAYIDDVAAGRVSECGWPANSYRVSKAGLSALTRILARDWTEPDLLINCVCPGWVRTDMGGPSADRSVEEGAETPVWLATAAREEIGGHGLFYRDKTVQPWVHD